MSNVIVIGAGAAGMMAAIAAAGNGHQVTVLEKNEKAGKKIYITGKGRCNITNACDVEELFNNVVTNKKFLYSAFYGFTNDDVVAMLNDAGLATKVERGNRVFPVSDRAGEVDVTHAFAANLGAGDFNAALFADHAAILEALVLAAKALIILHRAKDLGTEKTVAFRLLGTIVNRLRLLDFTVGPGVDLFGTGKSDADRVEMIFRLDLVEDIVKRHSHRLISP